MPAAPVPVDEAQRLEALQRYAILDSEPEAAFDDIVQLARRHFNVPIALVALMDENRLWFKSICGMDASEVRRDITFCSYTILSNDIMVVPDAREDERFLDNPLVTDDLKIRFYAGAPITTEDGYRIGTCCLIDDKPRHDFSDSDKELLRDLARIAMSQIEMRIAIHETIAQTKKNIDVREQLSFAEMQVRYFFEYAPVAVAMFDDQMRYIIASDTWRDTFKLSTDDLVGKRNADVLPHLPEFWRQQQAACLAGEEIDVAESELPMPDGSRVWLRRILRPWRRSDGSIGGVVAFIENITEQRAVLQQLVQSQKMESVGQLTGGMAHDFNNLLNIVLGNLQLLERSIGDDPTAQRRIHSAIDAVDKGVELNRRLLMFARRQNLERAAFSPSETILSLSDLLMRSLGENIDLECEVDDTPEVIYTDRSQFEAAIINLALNARDAMPAGGCLRIKTGLVHMSKNDMSYEEDIEPGEYLKITVADNGTGIAVQDLPRVVEPFFTTKDTSKGTGLGLSMVYGLARQSGGFMQVSSELTSGTTVSLYFPVHDHEPESVEQMLVKTDQPVEGSGIVLLVEDRDDVREIAVDMLNDLGYEVVSAENGQEAIDILAGDRPLDVVFTDVIMPGGIDGTDVAEAARKLRPGLPVLFASGYAEAGILRNGGSDISAKLITKPYRRDTLGERLRKALHARHAEGDS